MKNNDQPKPAAGVNPSENSGNLMSCLKGSLWHPSFPVPVPVLRIFVASAFITTRPFGTYRDLLFSAGPREPPTYRIPP